MGWLSLLAADRAFRLRLLWLLRVRGALLQLCGAALLLGAAGYAVQG